MDKFPDYINRKVCKEKLTINQETLIKEIRQVFVSQIVSAIDESEKSILLNFPEKLWPEHRIQICYELVERFGEVAILSKNGKYITTKLTDNKNDIPKNIESVKIEF